MGKVQRDFIAWLAKYCMSPLGFVLKMSLSAPGAFEAPAPAKGYKKTDVKSGKLTAQQERVLEALQDGLPRRASEIAEIADVSAGVVKGLLSKGLVEQVDIYNPAPCRKPDPYRERAQLSESQQMAADRLCEMVEH